MGKCVFGFDFGTLSCRGIALDINDGRTLALCEKKYEHGVISERMYHKNIKLDSEWCLQDPNDWMNCMAFVSKKLLEKGKINPADVIGLGTDFTSCTLLPVDEYGIPLCLNEQFRDIPNAWPKLWKHHGAKIYAEEIEKYAKDHTKWLKKYFGECVSSEWLFPKILQVLREEPSVYNAAEYFIEAVDWIPFRLTGTLSRLKGVLGVNAFWTEEYGFPEKDFFKAIDPRMENVVDEKLRGKIVTVGECVGQLTHESAKWLGLTTKTVVSSGHCDSAVSACGIGVGDSGNLILVMGTSTCHQMIYKELLPFHGACAIAADGMLPGLYSYESGQPATGDIFAWFSENMVPKNYQEQAEIENKTILQYLGEKAEKIKIGSTGLIALDWLNGNRGILANSNLSGMLLGLSLDTKPEEIYRAFVEANLFGSKMIVDNFQRNNIDIKTIWAVGGIASKCPWIMNLLANILNREIRVPKVDNIPARGSAVCAAVASYAKYENIACKNFIEASERLIKTKYTSYIPNKKDVVLYAELYSHYVELHNLFGKDDTLMRTMRNMKTSKPY